MLSYAQMGKNVRAARELRGFTQEVVAEKMGVSVDFYRRLEYGKTRPNLERLSQISEILSTPIECFFLGTYSKENFLIPPATNNYVERFEDIANGCSPKYTKTMIAICKMIAQLEKQS